MASPVDVGGLPNHVKYCVSVLSLQWANIRTSPVGIPYNWYQSLVWSGVWFLLKNESCQNCVLTIPPCRGGTDEATGENDVKIGRRTWPHSPSLSSKAFAHAHRRAPRVFFTQMGWPDPNTRWPDPCDWPGYRWRQHDVVVTSSCTVGMPCQRPVSCHVSTMGPTCHIISREPSQAEPSRFWAEPRTEGEDSVQQSLHATGSKIESGPLIRPELFWSNLSRLKCDLDDFRLVSS